MLVSKLLLIITTEIWHEVTEQIERKIIILIQLNRKMLSNKDYMSFRITFLLDLGRMYISIYVSCAI